MYIFLPSISTITVLLSENCHIRVLSRECSNRGNKSKMQHWKWISDTTEKGCCYLLPPTRQIKKIMSIFQHTRKIPYPTRRDFALIRLVDMLRFGFSEKRKQVIFHNIPRCMRAVTIVVNSQKCVTNSLSRMLKETNIKNQLTLTVPVGILRGWHWTVMPIKNTDGLFAAVSEIDFECRIENRFSITDSIYFSFKVY